MDCGAKTAEKDVNQMVSGPTGRTVSHRSPIWPNWPSRLRNATPKVAPEAAAKDRETPLECEAEETKNGMTQTDHGPIGRAVSRLHLGWLNRPRRS